MKKEESEAVEESKTKTQQKPTSDFARQVSKKERRLDSHRKKEEEEASEPISSQ